jgi:type I restriction enzyme R subunit
MNLSSATGQPGLDAKFKDAEDPLRLVFVCAMWLTGFDAPSCSTVYLDKPMRNHTLMQTIARANRVFPGKHGGVIVDYANVFASLEKSLAIYGAGKESKGSVNGAVKNKRSNWSRNCARRWRTPRPSVPRTA